MDHSKAHSKILVFPVAQVGERFHHLLNLIPGTMRWALDWGAAAELAKQKGIESPTIWFIRASKQVYFSLPFDSNNPLANKSMVLGALPPSGGFVPTDVYNHFMGT